MKTAITDLMQIHSRAIHSHALYQLVSWKYKVGQCFSTFSVKRNPLQQFWLLMEPMSFGWTLEARRAEMWGRWPTAGKEFMGTGQQAPPHQLGDLGERCKSLENASSGRKCQTQCNFLLSTGCPAEPLDATGGTLRFRGTPVEKHWSRPTHCHCCGHHFCGLHCCGRQSLWPPFTIMFSSLSWFVTDNFSGLHCCGHRCCGRHWLSVSCGRRPQTPSQHVITSHSSNNQEISPTVQTTLLRGFVSLNVSYIAVDLPGDTLQHLHT